MARKSTLLFVVFNILITSTFALQFITGPCTSDADCASGCCGFNSGKCAGPVVAQERDGGCGFGDAQPNANAAASFFHSSAFQASATAMGSTLATVAASPTANGGATAASTAAQVNASLVGNGQGKQFITGSCSSDADCAEGCCGFHTGKCAGPVVAQQRDGGCGFGSGTPNADAARAFGFTGAPGT